MESAQNIQKVNVKKKFAAAVSIFSNTVLILIKITAGVISGSLSIISEALHSLVDLLASAITFFSVIKASEPDDDDHPFGHGKYEDLAGFVEAILIILTALYILYAAAEKLIRAGSGHHFETTPGIIIMSISCVVNFVVSRYLFHVAKVTDSIALHGDAGHLSMDVYSSLGILAGLAVIKYTGLYVLDPIIAIAVSGVILRTGLSLTKQTSNNLLDGTLPDCEKKKIKDVLQEFKERGLKGVKSVKASKSGSRRVIQLVIFLPCKMTLEEAHKLCDDIENSIKSMFVNASVIIHAEPNCISKNRVSCSMCEKPALNNC